MPLVHAVAPVAVAPAIVELAVLSLIIFLLLLRRAWVSTFGRLLRGAADKIDSLHKDIPLPWPGKRLRFRLWGLAGVLRAIDQQALNLLGAGIEANQWAAHNLWHWIAYMLDSIGRVVGDHAEAVEAELRRLWERSLPAYVSARLHPLASKVEWIIHRLEHEASQAQAAARPLTRALDPRVAQLEAEVARLAAVATTFGAAVLAPPVAIPRPDVHGVTRGIDDLRARLGRLSRLLNPAAVLGLVAAALATLRLGWLKCGNVRRAGEHVCRMDAGVLDGLLAGTLAVFGTVSLVEFAEELSGLMDEIEPAVRGFWRA